MRKLLNKRNFVSNRKVPSSVGVLQKSEMTQILLFIKTKGHLISVSSKYLKMNAMDLELKLKVVCNLSRLSNY